MHNHFHSNPDLRPAGERFFVRSEAGEDVPLRRIRLSDTPECFGDKAQGIAPRPTDVAMMLGRTSRACASGSSPK